MEHSRVATGVAEAVEFGGRGLKEEVFLVKCGP